MAPDRGEEGDDTSALFDADGGDMKVIVPECHANTAALYCIEELGVAPPPSKGWVPREEKVNSSRSGQDDETEWYRNMNATEWIYHKPEDMYYHLPTSSLWEKRQVDCSDPTLESFSYFRADAGALKALAQFAMTLDSGLLPLAFKGWVRIMRKRRKGGKIDVEVSAPNTSPSKNDQSLEMGKVKIEEGVLEQLPPDAASSKETPLLVTSPGGSESAAQAPVTVKMKRSSTIEAPAVMKDANNALQALLDSRATCDPDAEDEDDADPMSARLRDAIGAEPIPESDSQPLASTVANPQEPNPNAESQLLASKPANKKKKGLFCLRCFRSSDTSGDADDVPLGGAQSLPTVATDGSANGSTTVPYSEPPGPPTNTRTIDTTVGDPLRETATAAEQLQQEAKQLPCIGTAERHMRKLEVFLDLVKRNPQKLVEHIEKRRQGKTSPLAVIVA